MSSILEALGRSKEMLVDYVPHSRALGLAVEDAKVGETWLRVPWNERLVGNPATGVLHGGVITTVLDNAAGVSVATAIPEMRPIATLDLRIEYMKPATPGRDVVGWTTCYKVTRNVAFVRGAAYHESPDDPIATTAMAMMLGAPYGGAGPGERSPALARFAEASSGPIAAATAAATAATDAASGTGRAVSGAPTAAAGHAGPSEVRSPTPEEATRPGLLPVARVDSLVAGIPYCDFLGISVEGGAGDEMLSRLRFAKHIVGNPTLPAVHGGAIGAFLETAAILELLRHVPDGQLPKPINLTIAYLRSAGPHDTLARATVTKHGRRVANVRVEAWQTDRNRPVAAAQGHFLLP